MPAGNIRAAPLNIVCKWVIDAWKDLGDPMIQCSFKKCGISNAIDGAEDDPLWEDANMMIILMLTRMMRMICMICMIPISLVGNFMNYLAIVMMMTKM